MSRSWARRAQTELSSLIAVFAVCAGLALYAGYVGGVVPDPAEPRTADVVADRVGDDLARDGVVVPSRLDGARIAAPPGRRLNVTLAAATDRWTVGPPAPARARTATTRVGVRIGPGRVRPGRLRVAIWR